MKGLMIGYSIGFLITLAISILMAPIEHHYISGWGLFGFYVVIDYACAGLGALAQVVLSE